MFLGGMGKKIGDMGWQKFAAGWVAKIFLCGVAKQLHGWGGKILYTRGKMIRHQM